MELNSLARKRAGVSQRRPRFGVFGNYRLSAPRKIPRLARSLEHQLVAPRPVCVRLKHIVAVILDLRPITLQEI